MDSAHIPFSFVASRLDLTWVDIAWAFDNGWLSAEGVIEYAVSQVADERDCSPTLLELSGLRSDEQLQVPLLLDKIVARDEVKHATDSKRKWLYLILAWMYQRRADIDDPLGKVEELYADFDYPDDLRPFVRYMPPEDGYVPQAHTKDENIDRLFKNWEAYLGSPPNNNQTS